MRVPTAFLLVAACAGCSGLDSAGLAGTVDLLDAAETSTIAADVAAETDQLEDSTAPAADATTDTADSTPTVDADSAPTTPFCDKTDPTLIACYRFESDEKGTQPFDESMYAHHGTVSGATFVAGRPGAGKALAIAPASAVRVPYRATLVATTQLTIEAWIHTTNFPATGRAGLVDLNGGYGLFLLPGGAVRATGPAAFDTAAVVINGAWVHVAYTYDGLRQVMYVNGVQVADKALAGGIFGVGDAEGLAIGHNSPSGDNLDGMIDSVRIWRIARSAKQICSAAGTC